MVYEEALVLFFLIVGIIVFAAVFLVYLADSYIHYKVFKTFMTCNPLIGFVPFLSQYMLGRTCNGKDGYNEGIFGIRLPNVVWNFGWLIGVAPACSLWFFHLDPGVAIIISQLSSLSCSVFSALYYASIYSFIYSRIENRPEREVRVISILSAVIGVVGFIKIFTSSYGNIYSLHNDEFPREDFAGDW